MLATAETYMYISPHCTVFVSTEKAEVQICGPIGVITKNHLTSSSYLLYILDEEEKFHDFTI